MSDSFLRALRWAALGGACLLLLGASGATATSTTTCGTTFNLGTGIAVPNTCDAVSALKGAAGTELDVESTLSGGQAIRGLASGDSGNGIGLAGQTNSNGANAYGTAGVLNNGSPGLGSAGLFGYSFSTNDNGPGVYGQHASIIGSSPGILGETSSGSANATGVTGHVLSTTPGGSSAGVRGINEGKGGNGVGVWGSHAGYGTGVYGISPYGRGLWGFHTGAWSELPAVEGDTNSRMLNASAVKGVVTNTAPGSGSAAVRGVNNGTLAYGVGVAGSQSGYGTGVYGMTPYGRGVFGEHTGAWGNAAAVEGATNSRVTSAVGVQGVVTSTNPADGSTGVRGINNGTGANGIGVWGSQAGAGRGVYGFSPAGKGVVGESVTGFAGYFIGNVRVTGTLAAAVKNFQIDDPLDPAHKYLQHASVESSELKNIYDGIATTDAKGFATVELPGWFEALNGDFRYQLTSLSGLQELAVAREISHNRFTIQSQKPFSRVSWQVTGVRHDAYARAHPLKVVQEKPASAQGTYIDPGAYGQPQSKAEVTSPRPPKWSRTIHRPKGAPITR